jgi:hypothetical protein
MKKYIFIFAIGVAVTLTACGSRSTTNETTDSTGTQADTSAVIAVDSTKAAVDTTSSTEVK